MINIDGDCPLSQRRTIHSVPLVEGGPFLVLSIAPMQCTFLDISDHRGTFHASTKDAFDLAKQAKVKRLMLYHFSQRYTMRQIEESVREKWSKSSFRGEVYSIAGYTESPTWYFIHFC